MASEAGDPSLLPATIAATTHDDRFGVLGVSPGWIGISGWSAETHGVQGLSFAPPREAGVPLADAPAGVYGQSMNGVWAFWA
jgi:hypothetical protein